MKIQTKELEDYVYSALRAISNGVKRVDGFAIKKPIKLSLVVTNTKSASGGLKVYVTDILGKSKREELSRIEFTVDPIDKKIRI